MRRVAVTGIGIVSALGTDTEMTWAGLIEGKSGIGPIQEFDPSSLHTQIGGEIRGLDPSQFVTNRRTLRMMTRNDQLAVVGASLAMRDSGLSLSEEECAQAGLFIGSNKEISNPNSLLDGALVARNDDGTANIHTLGEKASSAFYPLFFVEGLQAAALFYVSQAFGLKGANTYFSGAADSGATAIGRAYRAVRRGESNVAVAGGFDDAISWWNSTKFDAMGILTDRNEEGARACKPYDLERDGAVLGEGAAFMILEELAAAQQRGARIYAEITGFGGGNDAYKIVTPHPEGRGLALAMEAALREAESSADGIGYVATHGSGTKLGDSSEAHALRTVFGAGKTVAASTVKAATGDLVGGAGALNVTVAALALHHQRVPPILNLEHPDPDCNSLDWVTQEARDVRIDQALALARGLEGQSVALLMRKVDG